MRGNEFFTHARKYDHLELFTTKVDFEYFAQSHTTDIICNPNDIFMATYYFTAQLAHFTITSYPFIQRNFIYFIQDYEPIFFPHDSYHIEALEGYRFPHFPIYSTIFLETWFREKKLGQYHFMGSVPDDRLFIAYPAIKIWPPLDVESLSNPKRIRTVVFYARSHIYRNAYQLTMDSLSIAICKGVFDDGNEWKFIGLGSTSDYRTTLGSHCNRTTPVIIRKNVPEPEYLKIVRTGDIGYSLMLSPHPSLPPFDFAAAGLIAVTNSFETKTMKSFQNISTNFIIVEPYIETLVEGLRKAVKLSLDISYRQKGAENFNWERNWYGPSCYGSILMERCV